MGKIRINTIGSEDEQKQKTEAEKRREAKKAAKTSVEGRPEPSADGEGSHKNQPKLDEGLPKEQPKKKMQKKSTAKKRVLSPRYTANVKLRDKTKIYTTAEALDILEKMEKTKFDETVELHINTTDKINGNITLPNGTGKQTKVVIFAPAKDPAAAEALLKAIEAGKIDFDVLVATPDAMPKLAKVARFLGPRGLMPNPKTGTVTTKPEEVAKKYEGGQLNFKTEAKANIVHVGVGKLSFGIEKLSDNIKAFVAAIDATKVTSIYLKSTMSPSLRLR